MDHQGHHEEVFGTLGGLGALVFNGWEDVADILVMIGAAALSATVGYLVKRFWDKIFNR